MVTENSSDWMGFVAHVLNEMLHRNVDFTLRILDEENELILRQNGVIAVYQLNRHLCSYHKKRHTVS